MKERMKTFLWIVLLLLAGWYAAVLFFNRSSNQEISLTSTDSLQAKAPADSLPPESTEMAANPSGKLLPPTTGINTKNVQPAAVVAFAKTQLGVPYRYGSTNPSVGFDCSGFITYVFNHFGIAVPRSSIDFTHEGQEVPAAAAKPGDLILFTGTNPQERFVGHMGIVVSNADTLRFIHATSGKQYGVTITPLNGYYKGRFVKTIRVFPQNG